MSGSKEAINGINIALLGITRAKAVVLEIGDDQIVLPPDVIEILKAALIHYAKYKEMQ